LRDAFLDGTTILVVVVVMGDVVLYFVEGGF
jgi:hypothetical protein